MRQLRVMAANAEADGFSAIRTETFRGRSYTVVPVVALVEGVIQGLNAEEPEFAPAGEFGKFPMTWNGRPITMGHPRRNGQLTSANDPDIREEYEFGFIANTTLEDGKLKMEAWLDDELIEEKGGEFLEAKTRVLDGELVEVSTGLFCDVMEVKGTFNSTGYGRAWANVVPDHLAFLEAGTLGACSVADGCGAPRLNELRIHESATNKGGEIVTGTPANLGTPSPAALACCDACTKGESCMDPTANEGGGSEAEAPGDVGNNEVDTTESENQPGSTETEEVGEQPADGGESNVEGDPEDVVEGLEANAAAAETLDRLVANAIAPEITFDNARQIVQAALRAKFPVDHISDCGCYGYRYVYVMAMNSDMAAFEQWDRGYESCATVAIGYSIDSNGGVTFTGEPVPVNLITHIVPIPASADDGMSANEGASGANQQEEGHMDEDNAPAGTETGTARANGAGDPPAPRTLEQFLGDAPVEVAAILQEGIALRTQKRNKLVEGIMANSLVFSKEELEAKDIDELSKLAVLSRPADNFSGRALPRFVDPTSEGITNNTQRENQQSVPAPVRAFEVAPRRKADYSDSKTGSSAAVN